MPCVEAHTLETVIRYQDVPGPRPTKEANPVGFDEWQKLCRAEVARYLGAAVLPAGVEAVAKVATAEEWADADGRKHTVDCRVGLKDGEQFVPVVGSFRGLGDRPPQLA